MTTQRVIPPWDNNPSAKENFYELNEEFLEVDENALEELNEEVAYVPKTIKKKKKIEKDPYSDILKEL